MNELSPYVAHERDIDVEAWDGIVEWRTLLSADRTPSAGLTVGIAEITPGSSEVGALHHHADHEAYYVIGGRGEVHLDGVEHPVEPGSVVFVPGGTPHFVRNTGTEDLKFLYVFAVDRFSDVVYRFPQRDEH
jgi:mannose-6-phosphate isomerase-like protein (cupin superfamily)